MKIEINKNSLLIIPDSGSTSEQSYVRSIIDRLLFAYDDTTIVTWQNGIKIIGNQDK